MVSIRGGLKSTESLNSGRVVRVEKRRGRKPKLSTRERTKVAELYLEGYSPKEISHFFKVSEMTVYRVVNEYVKENFSGDNFDEVFEKVKAKVWS